MRAALGFRLVEHSAGGRGAGERGGGEGSQERGIENRGVVALLGVAF